MSNNDEAANIQDEQEAIQKRLSWLFSFYSENDLSSDLKVIADYYALLAKKLSPRNLAIEVNSDLLFQFESIYLLLQDKLKAYPIAILSQVIDIVRENHICEIMAVASSMEQEEFKRVKFSIAFRSIIEFIPFIGSKYKVALENGEYLDIDQGHLFKLKVGLNRLSNILLYASSLRMIDYDETFYKFKENYDPELIDKNKLFAFVNILQVQIKKTPESKEQKLVLEKLNDIENELRKSKVRWGVVITGFFVLFGFMADLKTLEPNIYSEPYKIIQNVLSTIHEDGIVQKQKIVLLVHNEKQQNNNDIKVKQPHVAIPPKREDELEN